MSAVQGRVRVLPSFGLENLLPRRLSGSLNMLQVYDRVIPSCNIATLLGLSLISRHYSSGCQRHKYQK
jgi:ABC-type protease/lipase transport system fused ATPase/permease subunit